MLRALSSGCFLRNSDRHRDAVLGVLRAGPARPLQGPRAVSGAFCRDPSPKKCCPRATVAEGGGPHSPCPLHSPVGGSQGQLPWGWRAPVFTVVQRSQFWACCWAAPVREGGRSRRVGSPASAWAGPAGQLGLLPGWCPGRDRLVTASVTTRPVPSGGLDEGPSLPRLSCPLCALGWPAGPLVAATC